MGFLSSAFKGLGSLFSSAWKNVFKPVLSAPFEAVRDTVRATENLAQGVGNLAQGDLGAAFDNVVSAAGNYAKGSLNLATGGIVSENGIIDTKVKQEVDSSSFLTTAGNTNEAAVAFADAESPDVVIGADEIEEDLMKRKRKAQQTGFLGGLNNSSSLLV